MVASVGSLRQLFVWARNQNWDGISRDDPFLPKGLPSFWPFGAKSLNRSVSRERFPTPSIGHQVASVTSGDPPYIMPPMESILVSHTIDITNGPWIQQDDELATLCLEQVGQGSWDRAGR